VAEFVVCLEIMIEAGSKVKAASTPTCRGHSVCMMSWNEIDIREDELCDGTLME
jgi:hypothetical protein